MQGLIIFNISAYAERVRWLESKSHLTPISSLVSVKYFQGGAKCCHCQNAVSLVISTVIHELVKQEKRVQFLLYGRRCHLRSYSMTISQAAFSMLKMVTYYFIKTRGHQWNCRLTMTTFVTLWKYLTLTRLLVSVWWDFDT